jgi:uncharacterized OB-fold protein
MEVPMKPDNLKGPVGLTNQQFKSGEVVTRWDKLEAHYAWDKGVGMGAYLEGMKNGQIVGMHCPHCDRTVVPARSFCEKCLKSNVDFVPLAHTGTINTFSIAHVSWDVKILEVPELPAVIDIDGTNPKVGIMHMLGEVDPEDVKVGMRVEAVWKPAEERTGSILDIAYFRPIKD